MIYIALYVIIALIIWAATGSFGKGVVWPIIVAIEIWGYIDD